MHEKFVQELFASIDEKNLDKFEALLTNDVLFKFGNAELLTSKDMVREGLTGFFSSIKGLCHELEKSWCIDDTVICHGTVTYTRLDSTTLSVPFANILTFNKNLISKYLIYVDVSHLYS